MNRIAFASLALLVTGACANTIDRIADIGEAPRMAAVENPTERPNYQPVTTPLPAPEAAPRLANSLWRPGAKAFFRDQRAARVGDILTVNVDIADQADINNTTQRNRTAAENLGMPNLFGLETQLNKVLPEGTDPAALVGATADGTFTGAGQVQRTETVNLIVAAMVVQVLPNGNLVIQGRQEVRVNFEVRELTVAGIVRPEDISASNTIRHSQIAEARISYGGRGQITDVQQPRYGSQLLDVLLPF